jgi:DNA repair exonuclease SbcCD nuclease subunit
MRFLHTADWQIGMKCSPARSRADEARSERLKTVDRIVDVANQRAVDFVLIAGDLFDHRTPKAGDFAMVVAALKRLRMPAFVLPGNHDPAGNAGPYASPAWAALLGSQVTTIEVTGVHQIPGGELLVAPCSTKYGNADPTAWFGSHVSPPGAIRIGMAHGALQIGEIARTHDGNTRGHFPISLKAASTAHLDYLALGDWHSFFETADGSGTISYSGAPEATSFGEPDSGTVTIVTIDRPGERPQLERVAVGRLRWLKRDFEVSDDASIAALSQAMMTIERPNDTLVRVTVRGLCTPPAAEQLRGLEALLAARFLYFEMSHEYVARPETHEAWLELVPPGDLRSLVDTLLGRIERGEDAAVASRALDKLAEFAR